MALVISDSSTLIHLAGIGQLALLQIFFERVTIPPAVWREVVEQGQERAGVSEVEQAYQAGWIALRPLTDRTLFQLLKRDLHDGEAEVIALAIEQGAALTLLDETAARRVAERYNLPKTGIVGLLIRAKQEGHLPSLKTALDTLRDQAGFWLNQRLYERALRAVGEADELE